MKQFIYFVIALVFLTSLLPSNLSCQFVIQDPPEFNMATPWPIAEGFVRHRDGNQRSKQKESDSKLEKREKDEGIDNCIPQSYWLILNSNQLIDDKKH